MRQYFAQSHVMFDLTGKTALVTGGSRGIGAAIARALASQGADVAISFQSREDAARQVAQEIEATGRRAFPFQVEARNSAQLQGLWRESEAALERIDILVNNAGLIKNGFLAMTSEASWDEVLDVNLKAAFLLSKLAAKAMSRRSPDGAYRGGRIINISSQAAQMGDVMRASYAASKAGLIGLTKATARELAASGVTCNALAPGFIETDMTQGDEGRRENQRKTVPLARFGTPQEVAALAVFLASDEAAYITGQCFAIDGGLRM
jgi:3-oxoacyl-[acyl-carrier protein] reductase